MVAHLPAMTRKSISWVDAPKQCAIYRGELPVKTAKKLADAEISKTVRFAGSAVRTIFIVILIVVTAHVASPQIEHIWSLYETPGDLVRVALGLAVCVWLVVHLFILPKDAGGYRTWLYLGFAILPLSVLCAVAIW
jgi:F0F1-type ATP synthase membrane subunit a